MRAKRTSRLIATHTVRSLVTRNPIAGVSANPVAIVFPGRVGGTRAAEKSERSRTEEPPGPVSARKAIRKGTTLLAIGVSAIAISRRLVNRTAVVADNFYRLPPPFPLLPISSSRKKMTVRYVSRGENGASSPVCHDGSTTVYLVLRHAAPIAIASDGADVTDVNLTCRSKSRAR